MRRQTSGTIAIVGAGFSGLAVALQLRKLGFSNPIQMFGRGNCFGRGLAYETTNPRHWLNVPAHRMAFDEEQPDHFSDWLKSADPEGVELVPTAFGAFASRGLYGRYLNETLLGMIAPEPGAPHLDLISNEVTDIVPTSDGYQMTTIGGQAHNAAGIVLAMGHPRPGNGSQSIYFNDPWAVETLRDLKPGLPVLIIGTGLTMIDLALGLDQSDPDIPIVALSRRGLLPRAHRASAPWPKPDFSGPDRQSIVRLLQYMRREIEMAHRSGIPWQAVVDSLRPVTQGLWRRLSTDNQFRFLRHLRPWWDAHRHRMAPPAAHLIDAMMAQGRLLVASGSVVQINENTDDATVLWRPRGEKEHRTLHVQRVINATGLDRETTAHEPLRERLQRRGLVRTGPHGLGIDVTDGLSVIDGNGDIRPRMWALGPITRGVFWECTAVPDIRAQAGQLARDVISSFHRQGQ